MGNWQVHRDFYSGKADPVGRKYRQAGGRAGKDRKMRMRGEREERTASYSADGYEISNLSALYPSHGHVDPNYQFSYERE
jgi:hypothetical protein